MNNSNILIANKGAEKIYGHKSRLRIKITTKYNVYLGLYPGRKDKDAQFFPFQNKSYLVFTKPTRIFTSSFSLQNFTPRHTIKFIKWSNLHMILTYKANHNIISKSNVNLKILSSYPFLQGTKARYAYAHKQSQRIRPTSLLVQLFGSPPTNRMFESAAEIGRPS